MAIKTWPAIKDPDERKDYSINWGPGLGTDDTIASSAWSITEGTDDLVIDSDSFTDTVAIVWFSGGTTGTYVILNRIVTAGGRTYDQTARLRVRVK